MEKGKKLPIIQEYLNTGLEIERAKILRMDEKSAKEFYKEHDGRPYFEGLIAHTVSGPMFAMILSGKSAINLVRKLNGATNPANAEKGTIRRLYGEPDGGPRNAVHGSDSQESARREIKLIFGNDENWIWF